MEREKQNAATITSIDRNSKFSTIFTFSVGKRNSGCRMSMTPPKLTMVKAKLILFNAF